MLHRALEQFLTDVYFGDLDALFLDLPPGTGDIAISVAQLLPKAEILVVTTPQAAAADVAERAGAIATQTGQTVAGVIENMSYLEMPDGGRMELFGSGGGAVARRTATRNRRQGRAACWARSPWTSCCAKAGTRASPSCSAVRRLRRRWLCPGSPANLRPYPAALPGCRWGCSPADDCRGDERPRWPLCRKAPARRRAAARPRAGTGGAPRRPAAAAAAAAQRR